MQLARVLIAKIALRVATEDEVSLVNHHITQGCDCAQEIQDIRTLADLPKTVFCCDDEELIAIADTNKVPVPVMDLEEHHLFSCQRCARIGQYISTMPNHIENGEVASIH